MPNLGNSILFLEECKEFSKEIFDRLLQSLIQQKDFS
jgi:muramoyltetrapeptide carboxypeptidase LdcA involved in peptidoglycan recycling